MTTRCLVSRGLVGLAASLLLSACNQYYVAPPRIGFAEAPRPLAKGEFAATFGYDYNRWPDDAHGKPVHENLWAASGAYGLARNTDVRISMRALQSHNYDTVINSPGVGGLVRLKWSPAWTNGNAALIGGIGLGLIPRVAGTVEAGVSLGYPLSRYTPFVDLRAGTNHELGTLNVSGGSRFDTRYTEGNAGVRIVLSPQLTYSATINAHVGGTQVYARHRPTFYAWHAGGYLEVPIVLTPRAPSQGTRPAARPR